MDVTCHLKPTKDRLSCIMFRPIQSDKKTLGFPLAMFRIWFFNMCKTNLNIYENQDPTNTLAKVSAKLWTTKY